MPRVFKTLVCINKLNFIFDKIKPILFHLEEIKVNIKTANNTCLNARNELRDKSVETSWRDLQQLSIQDTFKFDCDGALPYSIKFGLTNEEIFEILSEASEMKRKTGSIKRKIEVKHELIGDKIEFSNQNFQAVPETNSLEINAISDTSNQFTDCEYSTKNQYTESENIETKNRHTETIEEAKIQNKIISIQTDDIDFSVNKESCEIQTEIIENNTLDISCHILTIGIDVELINKTNNHAKIDEFLCHLDLKYNYSEITFEAPLCHPVNLLLSK